VQEIREAIQQVARLRGQPKLSQVAAEYADRKDSSIGILVFGLGHITSDQYKAQRPKAKDQRPDVSSILSFGRKTLDR